MIIFISQTHGSRKKEITINIYSGVKKLRCASHVQTSDGSDKISLGILSVACLYAYSSSLLIVYQRTFSMKSLRQSSSHRSLCYLITVSD